MPRPVYPPIPEGVTRLTQSRLEQYLKCGVRYRFEREADVRHSTVRMMVGSGVHVAAGEDNRLRADGERPYGLPAFVDRAVAAYVEEWNECEVDDTKMAIIKGKDSTRDAARAYARNVAPKMRHVVEAEEPIVVWLDDKIQVAGTPDVITTTGIGDTKVGKPWNQRRTDRARQLTIGSYLHFGRFAVYPERVWIDSIHPKARGYVHDRFWSYRTPTDVGAVLAVVRRAVLAINAGIELPAPESAWWCAPDWCPFYRSCPFAPGRV